MELVKHVEPFVTAERLIQLSRLIDKHRRRALSDGPATLITLTNLLLQHLRGDILPSFS